MKISEKLADLVVQIKNCIETNTPESNNAEWIAKYKKEMEDICAIFTRNGVESCSVNIEKSNNKLLVFHVAYYHMNDCGHGLFITKHTIYVRSAFNGLQISISGINKYNLKCRLAEMIEDFVNDEVESMIEV